MKETIGYFEAEKFDLATGRNHWVGTGTREEITKRGFLIAGYLGEDRVGAIPGGWKPSPANSADN